MDLRSFDPLVTVKSDDLPPFFAETSVLSTETLLRIRLPDVYPTLTTCFRIPFHTPAFAQLLSLRQAVTSSPYFSGRSIHLEPVVRTYRMPLIVILSSALGLPSFARGGSIGSMNSHCSSVSLSELHEQPNRIYANCGGKTTTLDAYLVLKWPQRP